jgi:hypothetical protein
VRAVICERTGCTHRAKGAVAFQFFPPEAVMRFHGIRTPLGTFVLGLKVCQKHLREIDPVTFLGADVLPLAKHVEAQTGTVVDLAATKAVLVAFDDPEYLRLARQQQQRGESSTSA